MPFRFRGNGPPGALQVPFGEFTGFHNGALEFTNPTEWHPVTRTEPRRGILDGSEEPVVDGSTPSLTTRTPVLQGISSFPVRANRYPWPPLVPLRCRTMLGYLCPFCAPIWYESPFRHPRLGEPAVCIWTGGGVSSLLTADVDAEGVYFCESLAETEWHTVD